ncbi:1-acyl-sn-glycerol-3-phosphate acyltransferase 3 [Ricinus communis]|uniref:1-acylglycerol-3-phosphate O-acyltransferase n=1 Tax=Ricinus communis TaxID=3988 RepID=B9RIB8_RICCO|nr:1-acyl-sn-glycerol-3-phosphate acyltransferase 3 [Ricinus communis]AJP36329.1 lysophosphatidic acid acyltransferase 3 [Ricinus communis]EEF48890.1 lysophosphatidic acid acyltransferase, putative [Ricinus communis]|eukprot:XP_002513487.1 1-acyl-sn-glycerol-3-phosphate acyltransferase 3 [Ricinus communis]
MAIPAALAIVPIGILFFVSGFVVNLIQAVLFILVRPVSKSLHRRINKIVAELLWLELIWLVDWWAHLKIEVYADDETFELMGKEHALLICNHRSDIDWLVGWILAQRSGCLGSALAVMKKQAKVLPIIGWSMWFSDYLFLERSWAKDETTLKSGFKRLEDFPMPFWLALFVEGTRFTEAKLQAAQEYAVTRGLPIPRNVLLPRTKGFVSAVVHMRSFVPAIYDCTVDVDKSQPAPTMLRIFRRQSSVINLQIKRHSMQEVPETADGISQWCKDVFVTKDAMLEKYHTKGTFSDQKHQHIGRPKKSLFVVIFWSNLLIFGIVMSFQFLSFLNSWQVLSFSVTLLVLVTIVMQILIHSSESEHSTPPPKLTFSDQAKERLLQK